jgi:hypothetical protein
MARGEVHRRWRERNRERIRERQRERAARRRLERELRGEPPRVIGRPSEWRVVSDSRVSRVWAVQDGAAEEPGQRVLLGGATRLSGAAARRLARALAEALGVPLTPARPRQSTRPPPANDDGSGGEQRKHNRARERRGLTHPPPGPFRLDNLGNLGGMCVGLEARLTIYQ